MALDKAISHGKEHRTPYRHSKAFDRSCRNHGRCGYCRHNRTYNNRKRLQAAIDEQRENAANRVVRHCEARNAQE